MNPVAVVAQGALSGLGEARAAFSVGQPGEPARSAIARDEELARRGLRYPLSVRCPSLERLSRDEDRDERRAEMILELALAQIERELEAIDPLWRKRRIGIAIGTSGGGMRALERALAERAAGRPPSPELAHGALYFGPLRGLGERLNARAETCTQVLAACASSTIAIGIACRWLEQDRADLVIAGGYDALSVLIAAGFESLHATTRSRPAPFRKQRDGMVLGEGAALLALARPAELPGEPLGFVLGFGASSDAVHVTAPDRTGSGLARAAKLALSDAGLAPERVDLVSAHGTATPFNDAAEARAIAQVLGAGARGSVVHPFKGSIGHTLGAAGALETLAALDALGRGVLPAACGEGEIETGLEARLLSRNAQAPIRHALKLSTAFGGSDAALVLGARPGDAGKSRARRPVRLLAVGEPVQDVTPRALDDVKLPELKRERLDSVSALVLAAAARVLRGASLANREAFGVIVGSASATLEIDELFATKLRERGPRGVEPRRFPSTSPNLSAGECSIAFELTGPTLAVGAGPAAASEALLVAYDLIESGDAEQLLVVVVEDAGPVVGDLFGRAELPLPARGALAALVGTGEGRPLDREWLARAHAEARAAGGAFGGQAPGWPAFQAILAALDAERS